MDEHIKNMMRECSKGDFSALLSDKTFIALKRSCSKRSTQLDWKLIELLENQCKKRIQDESL